MNSDMNTTSERMLLEKTASIQQKITQELSGRIVGQHEVIEQLLIALLAGGHVLLVGVPGLAKTLIIKTLADALSLQFGRIQFTPDLMPTDITGTDILENKPGGGREFRFIKGPLFCNLLLADELNRTPPKTQAALLQAMQETSVTAGGSTYELPKPFLVFATQNPIEQAGTYPLPEAQLDRFMFQVSVKYPSRDEEFAIVRQTTVGREYPVSQLVSPKEILELQKLVPTVPCADHIIGATVDLVRRTRPEDSDMAQIRENVSFGAGPRAAQMLVLAAKARTLLHGRFAVDIEDIRALTHSVLRHRLVLSFEAEARGFSADSLIDSLLSTVSP
ncbi:MAG: MoxR family ATPase [Deltaproteobacteria bacterium]|nr:MoxR family ATPase [Deltaproteobacteria bacterium]MBN2670726.1 MoxR family ATPase [Deltaproteobacteria bacterium]